jgi:3-deoxy-manno-octulosonate cytidylyltransferase (CMP-KDO synthetase)
MSFIVIIPARFGSTRFPGKPLADIHGKPMIQHVVERSMAAQADAVYVATDDVRIESVVNDFGANVIMTSPEHQSGTERLAEVVDILNASDETIIVNVQGDEPHIPVDIIRQVAQNLAQHPEAVMATLACAITTPAELMNPNAVKVVMDKHGMAMYFSRAPLPYVRDEFMAGTETKPVSDIHSPLTHSHYRHIGIYAYRAGFIKEYMTLTPSDLEQIESLEQLRVLYHGYKIHVAEALSTPPPGIDTPEDLANILASGV